MTFGSVLAALAWDPEIRGVLSVLVGVVVLCGSAYLLLATNTGARLGLLLALGGLFGFLSILFLYFWINPPAIGPAGDPAAWAVEEVHFTGGQQPPRNVDAQRLPVPEALPEPEEILAANPGLEEQFLADPVLSDIAGVDQDLLPSRDELGGWRVVPTADAGEAQAAAVEALVVTGQFTDATDFVVINTFAIGGKQPREEACDPEGSFFEENLCAAWHRIRHTFTTHPTHYSVVEVQQVIPQEAEPGAAPPVPTADTTQPVIRVIMERQLATTRLLPFTYFAVSFALFIAFTVILHYREKTLEENLALAERERAAR